MTYGTNFEHGSCGCGCGGCSSGVLERPRYFPRQLVTPVDMTLEQTYFRDKLRRHNRLLHGWGVVCGAQVCPVTSADTGKNVPWKVSVQAGYILGPYGDEITIPSACEFDIRSENVSGRCDGPPDPGSDPWCSEVFVQRPPGTVYVAVRFKEIKTRPVRTQPVGCGCGDTQCEYSRLCDGYELGVLDDCPGSHQDPPKIDSVDLAKLIHCPECTTDPWVVLAGVEVDENGAVKVINNCACRRLVLTASQLWLKCTDDPTVVPVEPDNMGTTLPETTPATPATPTAPGRKGKGKGIK